MLTEEEKGEILFNLVTGRFRYELRELEKAYDERNSLNFHEKQSFDRDKELEFLFLSKYSMVLGFYNHIESKVFGLQTYNDQKAFLIQSIIRSIVQDGVIDLREFDKKPISKSEGEYREYTRRTAQDLIQTYQGEFFETFGDSKEKVRDRRIHPFSTVHSVGDLPDSPQSWNALLSLSAKMFHLGTNSSWIMSERIAKMMRFGNPTYLESVQRFILTIGTCLKDIKVKTEKEQERINFLNEVLCQFNPTLTDLYYDCSSWVALKWWNKRKRKQKEALIQRGFKFVVDEGSVKNTINLMKKLGFDKERILDSLNTAGVGMTAHQKWDYSETILKGMLNLPDLTDLEKGIIFECRGVVAGLAGKNKKFVSFIKKSINYYNEAGKLSWEAEGYVYLGEARLRYNNPDGKEDFKKAEQIATQIEGAAQFDLFYKMANHARTYNDLDLEKHFLIKCRDLNELVPDDKLELLDDVCNRIIDF